MVGIFASNSWQWTTTSLAANTYNFTLVPMYDTLGDHSMRYIVKQCGFKVVFVDTNSRVHNFLKNVQNHDEGHKVEHIVVFEKIDDESKAAAELTSVELHNFDDLVADISTKDILPGVEPTEDDIFNIGYTSGTTGDPKGVVVTHKNWISDLAGCMVICRVLEQKDCWLSYLPAAHAFERMMQSFLMVGGASIGFYGGDTRNLIADAGALKPTFFGGVPRVWNKVYAKLQMAEKSSWLKGKLIRWAIVNKMELVEKGLNIRCSIYDKIVFKSIQALLGDRVDQGICGAAPIKNDVLNTIRAALGTYIYEGYGQTECCAACTFTRDGDPKSSVGAPIGCCAIKLDSVPEMDYLRENDKGEICIKGFNVMREYYKNDDKTKETVDEDGWLHTGDIGQWCENGTLQIIDRKKNIFKLAQGEYVAPEKIENVYTLHEAVAQCFVHGDSLKTKLVGVVVPEQEGKLFAKWAGKDERTDIKDLCNDESIKNKLLKELQDLGKTSGLKSFENVKEICLHSELMSVENNLLTPTMKTKRNVVMKHFRKQIDEMYEELGE